MINRPTPQWYLPAGRPVHLAIAGNRAVVSRSSDPPLAAFHAALLAMPCARITALDAGGRNGLGRQWPVYINVDVLHHLTALTRLRCECQPLEREGVWQLVQLQQLELHYEGPQHGTWEGLSALTGLRSLALLHFDSLLRGLWEDGEGLLHSLSALRALQQLTYLRLDSVGSGHGREVQWEDILSCLPGLQHLSIYQGCSSQRFWAALPALQGLTALQCTCWGMAAGPDCWQALTHLTRLQLLELKVPGMHVLLPSISTLAQLTELAFQDLPLHGGLEHLALLTRLCRLSLNDCYACQPYPNELEQQSALAALPPLPRLEALSLGRCGLRCVPFAVSALTALTLLDLSHNHM